jgi:hypothetical protein
MLGGYKGNKIYNHFHIFFLNILKINNIKGSVIFLHGDFVHFSGNNTSD